MKRESFDTPQVKCSQQRITEEINDIMSSAMQVYKEFQAKSHKKRHIAKTAKKKTPSKNRLRTTNTERKAEQERESIFLLPDDNSSQGQEQEYFIDSKPLESLAELKMLN